MLTDEQAGDLNEKVAKIIGVKPAQFFMGASPMMGRETDTLICTVPDFARDPMAFGHLIQWAVVRPHLSLEFDNHGACFHRPTWGAYVGVELPTSGRCFSNGWTPGEALCWAILAYAEGERNSGENNADPR